MEAKADREWFYRLGEEEFGPITWTELRRLVHSGKISRQHEVRICRGSHAGQWRPISTVSHLLPELMDEARSTEDEVQLEPQIITGVSRSEESPPKPVDSPPQVHSTSWGSSSSPSKSCSWDPLIDTLTGGRLALFEILEKLGCWTRRFSVPLICLTLWMSINIVYWDWASAETEVMQLEKVEKIGRRYFEFRKFPPDQQTWSDYVLESRESLNPLIVSFQRHASADRPIQQHLLWASRDCLLVMLNKPLGGEENLEKSYFQHIAAIRDKLRQAEAY